jgi:hypothetical protein
LVGCSRFACCVTCASLLHVQLRYQELREDIDGESDREAESHAPHLYFSNNLQCA